MSITQKSFISARNKVTSGSESSDYHSTNEFSSENTSSKHDAKLCAQQIAGSPLFSLRDRCYSFKKSPLQKYQPPAWISRLPKRLHLLVENNHGLSNVLFRPITKNGPVFQYVAAPDLNISTHQAQKLKPRTSSYCVGVQLVSVNHRTRLSTGCLQLEELHVDLPGSPLSIGSPNGDEKWFYLREYLLSTIKERLSKDNMFKIKDTASSNQWGCLDADSDGVSSPQKGIQGANYSNLGSLELQPESVEISTLLRSLASSADMLAFCTLTKENSIHLQKYLEVCSEQELGRIGRLFQPHYEELLVHRVGNYVLKKLVELDPVHTRDGLAAFCLLRFAVLARNEFASRVIQTLIELCPSVRAFALKHFAENFTECLENTAVVFLVISAIRFSGQPSETAFIKETLKRNPQLLGIKIFQRILVSYVQSCDEGSLEEVSALIKPEVNLRRLLNEKFSTYIILTMLQRRVELITHVLFRSIKAGIEELFETKFFKLLISKIFELKDRELTEKFSRELTALSSSQLFKLASKSTYFLFYLFITFSSFDESRVRNFVRFFKRLSSYPALKSFLSVKSSVQSSRH